MNEHVPIGGKASINLSTGLEDAEHVTVAFLVVTVAQRQGTQVA